MNEYLFNSKLKIPNSKRSSPPNDQALRSLIASQIAAAPRQRVTFLPRLT
jgi:hypothetical protein